MFKTGSIRFNLSFFSFFYVEKWLMCAHVLALWPVCRIAVALVAELVKGKAAVHQDTCTQTCKQWDRSTQEVKEKGVWVSPTLRFSPSTMHLHHPERGC